MFLRELLKIDVDGKASLSEPETDFEAFFNNKWLKFRNLGNFESNYTYFWSNKWIEASFIFNIVSGALGVRVL